MFSEVLLFIEVQKAINLYFHIFDFAVKYKSGLFGSQYLINISILLAQRMKVRERERERERENPVQPFFYIRRSFNMSKTTKLHKPVLHCPEVLAIHRTPVLSAAYMSQRVLRFHQ